MIRIRWVNIVVAALAGVCGAFSHVSAWAGEPVRNVGSTRQLFLDDWIIAESTNVARQPGEVLKYPGNPIIKRDKPWDRGRCDLYGSAVYNPSTKLLQVFYSAVSMPGGHDDRLALAVSKDMGKTWTKPGFGQISFNGRKHNNLVLNPAVGCYLCGPAVFLDTRESNAAKRYKMFTSEWNGVNRVKADGFTWADPKVQTPQSPSKAGMYVAYSPDGIHWTRPSTEPFSRLVSDTEHSVFWDARLGKYVAYVRAWPGSSFPGGPRSVGRMESNDFATWSEPKLVFQTNREIYSMGVTPYQDIYIGTPWIFDASAAGDNPTKPVMWPELAVSRDGIAWSQPFARHPLVPTGPPGSADAAQIRMSSSLVVLDDKIILIYGQTDRGHVADMRVDVGMATMRLDGFASMVAGDRQGTLRTKPFVLSGDRLFINAATDTAKDGSIRVAVLDESGSPIAGFGGARSEPITGDGIHLPVVWQQGASLEQLAGQTVRLEFQMRSASLFSFVVQPRQAVDRSRIDSKRSY
jgi:hypothetical protein